MNKKEISVKSGRGGPRGGGRPRKNRIDQHFSADQDVVQILNEQQSKSDYINESVRYYYSEKVHQTEINNTKNMILKASFVKSNINASNYIQFEQPNDRHNIDYIIMYPFFPDQEMNEMIEPEQVELILSYIKNRGESNHGMILHSFTELVEKVRERRIKRFEAAFGSCPAGYEKMEITCSQILSACLTKHQASRIIATVQKSARPVYFVATDEEGSYKSDLHDCF